MQQDFQRHLDNMTKHGIQAQLVREFITKGLAKPAIQSINIHLNKLETQATVLRNIALQLQEGEEV